MPVVEEFKSPKKPGPDACRAEIGDLLANLWPMWSPDDSALRRRNKLVVRGTNLATLLLVGVAVAGTVGVCFRELSTLKLLAIAAAGIACIGWALYGTRDATRFMLWHDQIQPPPPWPTHGAAASAVHVAIQFALAELIIWLAGPFGMLGLLWLVLLPPISYVVIFRGPLAITFTCVLSIILQTFNIVHWHGWVPVPVGLPGFAVAVLFTLVFTQIAVNAEHARAQVQRLAEQLSNANDQLRENALQAEELAATRERNRVAREIHDSLGHCLTVVHVQLEAARATFDKDRAHALDALAKAQAITHSGLQEIRRSVSSLRTSPLRDRPLVEGLQQLVAESQVTGLFTELTVFGDVRPVSAQAGVTLFRAAQEGLTNSRRHAGAKAVSLQLSFRQAEKICLVVSDDGTGAAEVKEGFGLLGLRERVQLLGGEAKVTTSPGQGFTLEVELPG